MTKQQTDGNEHLKEMRKLKFAAQHNTVMSSWKVGEFLSQDNKYFINKNPG